jgi:hypothetical protein
MSGGGGSSLTQSWRPPPFSANPPPLLAKIIKDFVGGFLAWRVRRGCVWAPPEGAPVQWRRDNPERFVLINVNARRP